MAERDFFRSPKLRLRRANEHAARFERQSKAFMDTVPFFPVTEPDANGITQSHKIRLAKPIPEDCEIAATEAIEALRSVLDHIGAAVAYANGVAIPKSAKFPSGKSPKDVEDNIRSGCRELPDQIKSLFRSFKPYEGGNDRLWTLNQLRNPAQHRVLAPIGAKAWRTTLHKLDVVGGVITVVFEWDAEKNEITAARSPLGTQVHLKAETGMFITFAEPERVRGLPAAFVLNNIADEVEHVLTATEAECRRISLVS